MIRSWSILAAVIAALVIVWTFVSNAVRPGTDGLDVEQRPVEVAEEVTRAAELPPADNSGVTLEAASISLPDGEMLEISWRRQPAFEYPAPPFGHQYEMFRHKAESGDGISALILHGMAQMCQRAFDSEEDLENAIDMLQQTHTVQYPHMTTPATLTDPEQIPMLIQRMTSQYEDCLGLDVEQESDSAYWLKMAAERHVPIAMIEYANQIADPQEALIWFEGAWREGEAEGLLFMSNVYFDNFNSGRNPGDNVNGYAALLAFSLLVDAGMGGPDHGPVAHRQVQRVKNQLEKAKQSLRQYELDEATALASRLISANGNCCLGM